ncbi:MAG: hypothetical protein Q9182_005763, partial [Xanthomendoza sp. 2 TL-2023]
FFANILERLVPRAEAGDRLSPDGSTDQEPNARGIPVALQDKPSLTMIQVRQRLAIAHNLRKEKNKKPVLYAEDEFELLKTLYTSTETTFPHERYRVQLALIMQLAGITGNRPTALLAVRYRHIKVTLLPDPKGGEQPRVLIEIVFYHTKGYLGEKDAYVFPFHVASAAASDHVAVANGCSRNKFGIPDVPNKPCLLLCPYITMLALHFADQAFAASSLTLSEQLFRLRIAPGQK